MSEPKFRPLRSALYLPANRASAIAKAKVLAEAADVNLGRILEISETYRQPPRPRTMARMETAMAADAAVPIAAGENTYSVTVNIRWELEQ